MERYRPAERHPAYFCEKSFFIIFVVFETSSRDEYHLNVK